MGYEKSEKTMGGKANTSGNDHGSGTFVNNTMGDEILQMG
jgi:hypothetical protein